MSSLNWAEIYITNTGTEEALIQLYHYNKETGSHAGGWIAAPNKTVGPLLVYFKTGFGSYGTTDMWKVRYSVMGTTNNGVYVNDAVPLADGWKECMLESSDAQKKLTWTVNRTSFQQKMRSWPNCESDMHRAGPAQKISNVFVLMLENHSFDNMFAMSEIPGLTVATTKDFNESKGKKYYVKKPALSTMPTDPHHEFNDVVEQLCGMGKKYSPVTGYPPIDNSGFAASYATTSGLREGQEGLIMECFETQKQLPVIYKLATEFAICDHWYSSLPGPTWPNRFFIHLGYSNGLDDSPSTAQMAKWETVSGFTGEDGSVFDQLNKLKKGWRLYGDKSSRFTDHRDQYNGNGGVAQVASLKNISLLDVNPIDDLPGDFLSPYEAAYTFIEPNYGSANTNYKGGSSQHPMDDTYGGEALIKFVYESLRNSPIWETSLLLITYDEHGGFYDSVAPPQAPPPNRSVDPNLPVNHFFFKTFGVRVPAVVVSPYIPKGTVSDTEYDHTSLLKTLQELFGIMALTDRQDQANSLMPLLDLNALRTDCPTSLPSPFKGEVAVPRSTQPEVTDDQLLPEKGNFIGTLGIILKTNIELFAQTQEEKEAMRQEFLDLKTYGQANAYIKKVTDKVDALIGKKRFRS